MSFVAEQLRRIEQETFVARVEHHPVIDSTNHRARRHERIGDVDLPLLILADRQTAGRGRGANRWWTGPGSLAMSLMVDEPSLGLGTSRRPLSGLAAGVAVVETVAPLLPGHEVGLHWPNDVMVDEKKLAGVLVEGLAGGRLVVGIGLNTNNRLADAPAEIRAGVTTMRNLTGAAHDQTALLVQLLKRLEHLLRQLGQEPAAVARRCDELCLQRGQSLAAETGGQTIRGRCAGVGSDGALLIDTPEGRRELYSATTRNVRDF